MTALPYVLPNSGFFPRQVHILSSQDINGYVIGEPLGYIIHDRADDRLVTRRLQQDGADAISANDLLQIALGQSDGFTNILSEYGVDFLSTLRSVPQIVETLHLDHMQATKLLAILALGRRVFHEPEAAYPVIRGIEDIYTRYRSMASLAKEQLVIALVNSRYLLVYDEVLAVGRAEVVQIPAFEVFHPAVLRQIYSVILIHNHVSGDATPSPADWEFSSRIQEAATVLNLNVLDHVIIGKDGFASCLHSS